MAFPFAAKADCAAIAPTGPQDYKVVKIWDIHHVADKHPTGCLALLSKNDAAETFVYSPYDFVCKTPSTQNIKLNLLSGCCDAGRDGDYACGVMADNAAKNEQTSLTATPAIPDARAIPELVEKLTAMVKNREMLGIGSVSENLALYAKNPEFMDQVQKNAPRLEKAFNAASDPWARKAIGRVFIALSGSGQPDIKYVASMMDTIYALDPEQIVILRDLQKTPRHPEKMLPVLMETLENVYEDQDILVVMQAIGAYGRDSTPYLQAIFQRLKNLPRERSENRAPPEMLLSQWKSMVCLNQPVTTTPSVNCTNR